VQFHVYNLKEGKMLKLLKGRHWRWKNFWELHPDPTP